MNILVFDVESTRLTKPFIYDIGYCIYNTETKSILKQQHFIIEQIWHNLPLFESAYYKDKRPQYVSLMRAKKATMIKYGYAMQEMIRDIKAYEVVDAYAYNSDFDEGAFTFNCDWFKTMNPFDNVAIYDIWGYVSQFVSNTDDYQNFCEEQKLFTDTGNYKASAESVYRYITNAIDFNEQHMGLDDTKIEMEILNYCVEHGAEWAKDYQVIRVIPRKIKHPFTIKINNKIIYQSEYSKKYNRNDIYSFTV